MEILGSVFIHTLLALGVDELIGVHCGSLITRLHKRLSTHSGRAPFSVLPNWLGRKLRGTRIGCIKLR